MEYFGSGGKLIHEKNQKQKNSRHCPFKSRLWAWILNVNLWLILSCEYFREFSKKFETVLMGYSEAGGKLIDEKNQKQKISWHCPFKLK